MMKLILNKKLGFNASRKTRIVNHRSQPLGYGWISGILREGSRITLRAFYCELCFEKIGLKFEFRVRIESKK